MRLYTKKKDYDEEKYILQQARGSKIIHICDEFNCISRWSQRMQMKDLRQQLRKATAPTITAAAVTAQCAERRKMILLKEKSRHEDA